MPRITVILADDHQLVRQGLRLLLESEPDFRIIGEAGDGIGTIRLIEQLKPQVAVVDLMMPALNGLEVTRQTRRQTPATRVIILSMHANEAYVVEALRHGASGYVIKDSSSSELVQAVREVAAGGRYLSAPFSKEVIDIYAQRAKSTPLDRHETLSRREREILQFVAQDYTNSEIARRLFISARTVEAHRANMMLKLGLRTKADVIRYAISRGILPLDPATPTVGEPAIAPESQRKRS